jgi:hypothetical protein
MLLLVIGLTAENKIVIFLTQAQSLGLFSGDQ